MKKNIALVAGGYTGESVISMKSAAVVYQHLDKEKFNVHKIIISKEQWADEQGNQVDKNDFSIQVAGKKLSFDGVFIIVHGTPGEDGKLQGYFDMLGLPYTTCNAVTSAITMNKAWTKKLVAGIKGLHTAKSRQLFRNVHDEQSVHQAQLSYPLFVKPNNGGSSIGMSKVNKLEELPAALSKAFAEDEQILVEEFISGREFTVGCVRLNGEIQVLPITEIISSKEFFDYEAKYTTGVSQEITPADLPAEKTAAIAQMIEQVYLTLNCSGVVRVDFILQKENNACYFLEINTVPGQSENSIIPQQVRAMGNTMTAFYAALIEESLK